MSPQRPKNGHYDKILDTCHSNNPVTRRIEPNKKSTYKNFFKSNLSICGMVGVVSSPVLFSGNLIWPKACVSTDKPTSALYGIFEPGRIGQKLHISYNTVRAHLGNIFRKTGVKGKAGLILLFVKTINNAKI